MKYSKSYIKRVSSAILTILLSTSIVMSSGITALAYEDEGEELDPNPIVTENPEGDSDSEQDSGEPEGDPEKNPEENPEDVPDTDTDTDPDETPDGDEDDEEGDEDQDPEATPEVTPEVTPDPTPEITPEVTPEITPEVTPEPTTTPTPSPTPSPTPEPTATPTATPTPTTTPTPEPTATPTATPTPTPIITPALDPYFDTTGTGGFVVRLYTELMGRNPDRSGYDYWCRMLQSGYMNGREVAEGFFESPEFIAKKLSNKDYVEVLYNVFFDRESDPEGSDYWVKELKSGKKRYGIREGFYNSTEWANTCVIYGIKSGGLGKANVEAKPTKGMCDFVKRLYKECLGRNASDSEVKYWADELYLQHISAKEAAMGFFFSPEFTQKTITMTPDQLVGVFYKVFLERTPEKDGLDYWKMLMELGDSRCLLFNGVSDSYEFEKICLDYSVIAGDHIELPGISGEAAFLEFLSYSWDAPRAIALLNSVPLNSHKTYTEFTYLTDHYSARTCTISDRDIQVLEQFAKDHFDPNWTPGMKVVYTAWWITQNSDYAEGSDWNIIGSRGYADAIINCHLGQCAQYNGCLLEMMAWLGYDTNMMFVPRDHGGGWQHYWCDVTIGDKIYYFDAGNEYHGYPLLAGEYSEYSRRFKYRPGYGLPWQ